MTIKKAIGLLQLLRHTCEKAEGCTGEAIDIAIDVMQHSIVKADIESIIEAVVRETGVTEDEMFGKCRHREYADARAIAAWLAYHYTAMTLTSIGKRMNRDHVMIIHYNRMVDSWLDEPRRNIKGARITTKLIRELEDDNETSKGSFDGVQQVAKA